MKARTQSILSKRRRRPASGLSKKPITTLADFLVRADTVHQLISNGGENQTWFRGHGNGNWSLKPRLYREDHASLLGFEDDFRSEFEQRAWPYLKDAAWEPRTQWEWYFVMQHYGMPTRLLDWTESSLIALYFALQDALEKSDGTADPAVWTLNPYVLNRFVARVGDAILDHTHRKAAPYLPFPFRTRRLPRVPIAVSPPYKTMRIASQQGIFTVHGDSHRGLETYAAIRRHCVKIDIARSAIARLKEELRVAGIGETKIFPELDALAREIVDFYRWEQPTSRKKKRPAPAR
jgi:FRG domain-containing protein